MENSQSLASASQGESSQEPSQQSHNKQRRRHRTRKPKNPEQMNNISNDETRSLPESSRNNQTRVTQRFNRADPSRVVQKPQRKNPKNHSPRSNELEQLKKGFPNIIEDELDSSKFSMVLRPSDPDFPFDISNLEFDLFVPISYPRDPPLITVTNSDIPKGFSVNVDLGFRDMARSSLGKKTLLDLINELDKKLEFFLKQEKRQTIKIVKYKSKPGSASSKASSIQEPEKEVSESYSAAPETFVKKTIIVPPEIKQARSTQVAQLIHRLGPDVISMMSTDERESIYNIILQPSHAPDPELFSSLLPHEFSNTFNFMLQVPQAYNLEPCSIIITSSCGSETENNSNKFPTLTVERNFNRNAERHTDWTLLTHVNFLISRLGKLIREDYLEYLDDVIQNKENYIPELKENEEKIEKLDLNSLKLSEVQDKARRILMGLNPTSAQINTIPENTIKISDNIAINNTDEIIEEGEEFEPNMEIPLDDLKEVPNLVPRGVALLLPGLSMKNIAILESQFVNMVVKCDRCSSQNDFLNVTSGPYGRDSKPIAEECSKCKATLAVCFRKNLIHLNGNFSQPPVAGYLEFSGCTPFDMLASTFIPTCENCATPLNDSPFRRIEKSKKATMNCRSCHIRLILQLDDIQFEKVSEDVLSSKVLEGVRVIKRSDEGKQKLGIVSGSPLPNDGSCSHYRKSKRWYRFSCCGKVYPCGKCHDADQDHPNEHATRIICGHCSREQNISNVCFYCRYEFQTKETGFWEGGKGTRDPTKLNRNDTRKHKKMSTPSNKPKNNSKKKQSSGGNSTVSHS
ncbi:uncharacterized protein SAPINGB_P003585 [Magnusiomyces paraingens]|uniref:CHY-type domain-containing protein n=1 Tax=Magnusiomyces paraingens TaxID=2606893 RepID=A0A5E8BQZ9_9ASCO|nr:uncharacterized protein SAPINGB_P003585 [Saprochaete ingens]VVT53461.1 unnamed protein product [Saprochaete ingens]